ncbi:hypothetical protein [Sinomonas terrae]|uniref:Uncharacterized protein n=1 Tax=Sinomonas terrae TaxID=2908838 RepID=A0ABS9U5Z2_9MICC|nr:hypothetical protein [Sinomonas terrae]MCH6472119.1 hypothetical protein [Sinomonas terrae]
MEDPTQPKPQVPPHEPPSSRRIELHWVGLAHQRHLSIGGIREPSEQASKKQEPSE